LDSKKINTENIPPDVIEKFNSVPEYVEYFKRREEEGKVHEMVFAIIQQQPNENNQSDGEA